MSLVTAVYELQLLRTSQPDIYTLNRISKSGNSSTLNKLFAWDRTVNFKKLTPAGILNDYILYPLRYGFKSDKELLLFETASFLHPFGVINIAGSEDCILFQIWEDLTITFFVFEGGGHNTAQLLQTLVDGTLTF